MRAIKKRLQPRALAEWRAQRLTRNQARGKGLYEELRGDARALQAVEQGLFEEQGGICAYTGVKLDFTVGDRRDVGFHLEHLIPQSHCVDAAGIDANGQAVDYNNLVACWPRPNCGFEPAYGARKKGSWPSPVEGHLFISPLEPSCTSRFAFNHRGEISPAKQDDNAAIETIQKLGLAAPALTALRREAIRGALHPAARQLKWTEAQKLLRHIEEDASRLDRGDTVRLRPHCFAIQQALGREIRKLEGIMRTTRG